MKTTEKLSSFFTINPTILRRITSNMKKHGYDEAYPIILGIGKWTDTPVIVDGHTRAKAATAAGVTPLTITQHFETEDDALFYHIHHEVCRTRVSESEIKKTVETFSLNKSQEATQQQFQFLAGLTG